MSRLVQIVLLPIVAALFVRAGTITNDPSINISSNNANGTINCDNLLCPNGTTACFFSEKNSVYNKSIVIVTRQCLDYAGKTLDVKNTTFIDTTGETYNLVILSGTDVFGENVTQSVEHKVKEVDSKVKKEMQKTLDRIKKELDDIDHWFHW